MQRRDFTRGLTASALTLPLAQPATANQTEEEKQVQKLVTKLYISSTNGQVLIKQAILLLESQIFVLKFLEALPLINENIVKTRIPLFDQLRLKRMSDLLTGSVIMGDIILMGSSLLIFPNTVNLPAALKLAIPVPYPNYKQSIRPLGSFRPARLKTAPTEAEARRAGSVAGQARLASDTVILELPKARIRPTAS